MTEGRAIRNSEKGGTFITILVLLLVLAVLLLWAVQPLSTVMQREREAELIFRGEQICEALRLYQKDHGGGFPAEMKELLKHSPQAKAPYLRRLFKNPFDPKGEWRYLAPGTTTIVMNEDGTKSVAPEGGMSQIVPPPSAPGAGGFQPGAPGGNQGGGKKAKVLPFKLDGREGIPILGVYAKVKKPAFRKYLETDEISEWFFSPLVIQPKPPVNLNPQPPPPKEPGTPGGPKDDD